MAGPYSSDVIINISVYTVLKICFYHYLLSTELLYRPLVDNNTHVAKNVMKKGINIVNIYVRKVSSYKSYV